MDVKVESRRDTIGPLRQLELVGRACSKVRRLFINTAYAVNAQEAADTVSATLPIVFGASSSSSTSPSSSSSSSCDAAPPFSQLVSLGFGADHAYHQVVWTAPALRRLAHNLQSAPLQFLELCHAPLHHLHHLSTLQHLRGLQCPLGYDVDFSAYRFQPQLDTMPPELHHYFQVRYSQERGIYRRRTVTSVDLTRAERGFTRSISEEEVDGELGGMSELYRFAGRLFVAERRFDGGKDGRGSFFDAVRQMSE